MLPWKSTKTTSPIIVSFCQITIMHTPTSKHLVCIKKRVLCRGLNGHGFLYCCHISEVLVSRVFEFRLPCGFASSLSHYRDKTIGPLAPKYRFLRDFRVKTLEAKGFRNKKSCKHWYIFAQVWLADTAGNDCFLFENARQNKTMPAGHGKRGFRISEYIIIFGTFSGHSRGWNCFPTVKVS